MDWSWTCGHARTGAWPNWGRSTTSHLGGVWQQDVPSQRSLSPTSFRTRTWSLRSKGRWQLSMEGAQRYDPQSVIHRCDTWGAHGRRTRRTCAAQAAQLRIHGTTKSALLWQMAEWRTRTSIFSFSTSTPWSKTTSTCSDGRCVERVLSTFSCRWCCPGDWGDLYGRDPYIIGLKETVDVIVYASTWSCSTSLWRTWRCWRSSTCGARTQATTLGWWGGRHGWFDPWPRHGHPGDWLYGYLMEIELDFSSERQKKRASNETLKLSLWRRLAQPRWTTRSWARLTKFSSGTQRHLRCLAFWRQRLFAVVFQ